MWWILLALVTGIPGLGLAWWLVSKLPAEPELVSMWLEDAEEDWRDNAAGLGGRR